MGLLPDKSAMSSGMVHTGKKELSNDNVFYAKDGKISFDKLPAGL
jgi:hypothetical protein